MYVKEWKFWSYHVLRITIFLPPPPDREGGGSNRKTYAPDVGWVKNKRRNTRLWLSKEEQKNNKMGTITGTMRPLGTSKMN